MFRGITKTLNKFHKKNDDLANSQFQSTFNNVEISTNSSNNENDLQFNSQLFNSVNILSNNKNTNTIKNTQIENEILNRNRNNNIPSQNVMKQEVPIRNSQIGLSGSQTNNYRRTRQNPLNNRYPNSSYKRSNTQTSKYNKPFKIPSIVEKKQNVNSSSQFNNSQFSNSQNNTKNLLNNDKTNFGNRILSSQSGFRSSNIFNDNEFKNLNNDSKIDLNKSSFMSSYSNSNNNSSDNNKNSNKKYKIPGPAGKLPILTPEERKILFYSHHINDIMKKRNNNYGVSSTQYRKNAQLNTSFKKAKERVDLALNKNEAFESGSWVLMLKTLDLNQNKTKIIDIVKLRFPVEKVKSIVVLIKRIKVGDMDVSLIVQDPTGDMPAIMTKEAYEKYFDIMNQGTTLLLKNVSIFVIYKKGSYLNIGIQNISKIYTLDNITKAPIVIDIDKINSSARDIEADLEMARNLFEEKDINGLSDDEDENGQSNEKDKKVKNDKGKGKEKWEEEKEFKRKIEDQDYQFNRSSTSKTIIDSQNKIENNIENISQHSSVALQSQKNRNSTTTTNNNNNDNDFLSQNINKHDQKILNSQIIKDSSVKIGQNNINGLNNDLNNIKLNELEDSDNDIEEKEKEEIKKEDHSDDDNDDESFNILMNDISFEKSQSLYSSFLNTNNRKRPLESKSKVQELCSSNISHISGSIDNNNNNNNNKNNDNDDDDDINNLNATDTKKIKLDNEINKSSSLLKINNNEEENDNSNDINVNNSNNDNINNKLIDSHISTSLNDTNNIYSSGSVYSRMFTRTESMDTDTLSTNIISDNNNSKSSLTKTITISNNTNTNYNNNNNTNNNNNNNLLSISGTQINISKQNDNHNDHNIPSSISSSISIESKNASKGNNNDNTVSDDDMDELDILMEDIDSIY
ncbi:hypothetical protein BCR32DRAFT_292443 [Anaeromyces robustus]|uniref:Homologous recombination OB-fold protein OB-fold domain-containing protein n=1 Tax=Anaeromyces robustus TaxID=1754192 RepID=A0A1Y1XAE7_9FUNG|nr:hypothetical protein BCR32DRAFT_292443 [Anaeromyces robustus]|eukprot:ORX82722.1 hypothetical protein BCR32DRAFT_292443 [Anaeromyces robustus]